MGKVHFPRQDALSSLSTEKVKLLMIHYFFPPQTISNISNIHQVGKEVADTFLKHSYPGKYLG